jgi:ABC-type multidrug transport system fused ATPase/permease subunit
MAYMEILAGPVSRAGDFYRFFQTCRTVGERLRNLLDDHETLPSHGAKSLPGAALDIVVEGVSFQHPRSTRQVLQEVSLTIQPGETIALVGRNGAGKSTLHDLLQTIQLADRILLLDRGRLLASGTHETLLVQSVSYRKLPAEIDHTSLEVHKVD